MSYDNVTVPSMFANITLTTPMHVNILNVFQHPNQNAEQTRNALTTLHAFKRSA